MDRALALLIPNNFVLDDCPCALWNIGLAYIICITESITSGEIHLVTFIMDVFLISESRLKINEEFRKNKSETDPKKLEEVSECNV